MIYLYHFTHYAKADTTSAVLASWFQTSNARPLENSAYPGVVFESIDGLTHTEIRYDSGNSSGQCNVTVPRNHVIAVLFATGYPVGSIYLRLIEVESTAPSAVARVVWRGRIRSCDFNEITAKLLGTDGSERLQRLGLRLNGGTACQWALFDSNCGVSEALYTRHGTVLSVSSDGLDLQTDLIEANSFFAAGRATARGQVRMVTASGEEGFVRLFTAIPGLKPGDAITATKGCDRSASVTRGCKSFDNYLSYSGFEGYETPRNIFAGEL